MNMTWASTQYTAMPLPSCIPHFERDRLAKMLPKVSDSLGTISFILAVTTLKTRSPKKDML